MIRKSSYNAPVCRAIPTEAYFSIVREQMAASGSASVRVTGVSMQPFLTPVRDTVVIEPYRGGMKRGDVILFDTRRGRYILHRVVKPGVELFSMRGDNTPHGENGLPCALIVGTVTGAYRDGKYIARDSALWRVYALRGAVRRAWRSVWNARLRPALAKVYHIFVPRKETENNGGN